MPAVRTEVTEIVTGLGMLARYDNPRTAVLARPVELRNVPDEVWDRLTAATADRRHRVDTAAAWANGRAFLGAAEGLRGRRPLVVEWKGPHRAPGDEVVPADLRIDHVYLVSCKYLSKILVNASPAHLFDRLLRGGQSGDKAPDWFATVTAEPYQELYAAVRTELGPRAGLPPYAADLTPTHRGVLRTELAPRAWPPNLAPAWRTFACEAGRASADRWRRALRTKREREAMLWRLLRIGSAPYFVLGSDGVRSLRLRIATPWDWRQAYDVRGFDVWGDEAGQPVVRWAAHVHERAGGEEREVAGHVEIRWSHGRFAQGPEAKAYLDTSHHRVPGYTTIG